MKPGELKLQFIISMFGRIWLRYVNCIGDLMMRYEIRIRTSSGEYSVTAHTLPSDLIAVRCAQWLGTDADLIEVWRGMGCIYFQYASENIIAA